LLVFIIHPVIDIRKVAYRQERNNSKL